MAQGYWLDLFTGTTWEEFLAAGGYAAEAEAAAICSNLALPDRLLNQPLKDTLCGTKVLWSRDWQRITDADLLGAFFLIASGIGILRQRWEELER